MGNEISTLGGAVVTAATGLAAGVTFGQVDAVNNACKKSALYTADKACKTIVRHAGETVIKGAAAVGTSAAVVVTLGQVDCLNEAKVECVKQTIEAGAATADGVVQTVNDVADNVPVVGHVKGAVHYVFGDKEKGDKAMKSASRTTGVVIGGALGIVGGPPGMVAGGMVGGAAVDGLTTGVESAINREYTPSGTIEAWTRVAQAENSEEVTGGIIDAITTTVTDGLTGYAAGKAIKGYTAGKAIKKGSKTLKASKKKPPLKYGGKDSSGSENASVGSVSGGSVSGSLPVVQKLPAGQFVSDGTKYTHTLKIFPFRPDPVLAGLKKGGLL